MFFVENPTAKIPQEGSRGKNQQSPDHMLQSRSKNPAAASSTALRDIRPLILDSLPTSTLESHSASKSKVNALDVPDNTLLRAMHVGLEAVARERQARLTAVKMNIDEAFGGNEMEASDAWQVCLLERGVRRTAGMADDLFALFALFESPPTLII
ncbi:hypothetical protein MKZ38_010405 [Zalerion maritima]|uniref:Uncharacterized protein n=1 Tax=Zalerion maritima TaxID=339359 RepID=A0AAD5RTR9_9PEZI|nr:hypothetical protein MKZ38_010405 [Zalerion maritima]